ncbi:MAG: RecX family transcriptional regulator [Muribaculaceae bacterium]|nr:RecX family transcriptional regulator [Muribaculaceae bacterium]
MNKPTRQLTPAQALNRAAALCSRSEQAPGDIREKLLKWGLNTADAQQVLTQLTEQGFINEARFAHAFVNDRFTYNGWGRIKIAYQLRQKGIPPEVIDETMTAIDEERYRQRLVELLRAKWRTVKGREPRAAWAAMMRFAASRGFETGIAGECVKQVSRLDDQDD